MDAIEVAERNITDREKQAIAAGLNYSALQAADEAFQNSWCDESTMMNEPLAIQAAIAAYLAAAGVEKDKERLDWLEHMANQPGGILLHDGRETGRTGLGLRPGYLVRTLREAVDSARGASNGLG